MRVQVAVRYAGTGSASEVARVRYLTQVKARPPTFAVFASGSAGDFSERTQVKS